MADIVVHGLIQNNLKHVDVDIPLGIMIVVTGVAGTCLYGSGRNGM